MTANRFLPLLASRILVVAVCNFVVLAFSRAKSSTLATASACIVASAIGIALTDLVKAYRSNERLVKTRLDFERPLVVSNGLDLRGVVAIAEKARVDRGTLTFLALESYPDRFLTHTRLFLDDGAVASAPNPRELRWPLHPTLDLNATDDRGRSYKAIQLQTSGDGQDWRAIYQFTPGLHHDSRTLAIAVSAIEYIDPATGAPVPDETSYGPWTIRVML